jgi:DNA-binding NtrC family response regulator
MGAFCGKTDNILVVDSDRAEATKLSDMIGNLSPNYVVRCACSGSEAVEKSTKESAHVVFAAETLSDMTAQTFFEIITCIQNQPACILLAEENGMLNNKRSHAHTSFGLLKKPYNASELAYTLDRALDHEGLYGKEIFNSKLTRVFLALIPLTVVLGMVVGVISR